MIKLILLPNLITTLNLYFGFLSIIEASSGNFKKAGMYIIVASIFDFLDGRIARLLKESSRFGIEYDSIADIVSFGIAPAFLIYMSNNLIKGKYGIALAFIYVAAGALRLARFNVIETREHRKNYVGLPIPMAAILISSFVLYARAYGYGSLFSRFVPIFYIILALLMVSAIEYPSFKEVEKQTPFYYLFIFVLLFVLFILFPLKFLLYFSTFYIIYGPVKYLVGLLPKSKKTVKN